MVRYGLISTEFGKRLASGTTAQTKAFRTGRAGEGKASGAAMGSLLRNCGAS